MKKAMLTLVISAILSTAFLFTFAEEVKNESFARFCPSDTIVFLECSNVKALCDKFSQTTIAKLMVSSALRDFMAQNDSIIRWLDCQYLLFRLTGSVIDKHEGALAGRAAFAVTIENKDFCSTLAFAVPKGNDAKVASFFSDASSILSSFQTAHIEFRKNLTASDYSIGGAKGVKIYSKNNPYSLTLFSVYAAGHVLVTDNESGILNWINRFNTPLKDSLRANAKFQDCVKSSANTDMLAFVNPHKALSELANADIPSIVLDGLKALDAISVTDVFNGLVTEESITLLAKSESDAPLFRDLSKNPAKTTHIHMMPKDAWAYLALNLPSSSTCESLIRRLPFVSLLVEMVKKSASVSLYTDILPTIGGGMECYLKPTNDLEDEMIFYIGLKDEKTLTAKLDIVAAKLPNLLKKIQNGGVTMYRLVDTSDPPLGIIVANGEMILGSVDALYNATTDKGNDSLAHNDAFIGSMQRMQTGNANLVFFLDMPSVSSKLAEFLQTMFPNINCTGLKTLFNTIIRPLNIVGYATPTSLNLRSELPASSVLAAFSQIPYPFTSKAASNDRIAVETLSKFGKGAKRFAEENRTGKYWESEIEVFEPYFTHKMEKDGFAYRYFSDDTDEDGEDEATKYVYLAFPLSVSSGKYAYCITETQTIWIAPVTEAIIKRFNRFKEEEIFWLCEGDSRSRCNSDFAHFEKLVF